MKVYCQSDIFQSFPTASMHGIVFGHLDLFRENSAESLRLVASKRVQENNIQSEVLSEASFVKEWRNAYKIFGLKPSKYRSSVEQLYRRALKEEVIQTGIPLVDAYCYVSIIETTPMGGYDLSKLQGDIGIRYTQSGEEFLPIGSSQALQSDPGIVAYADGLGIICWAWNHRDSARTCLGKETESAIFFADSATEESRHQAERAIDLLAEALSSVGCCEVTRFILDSQRREADL